MNFPFPLCSPDSLSSWSLSFIQQLQNSFTEKRLCVTFICLNLPAASGEIQHSSTCNCHDDFLMSTARSFPLVCHTSGEIHNLRNPTEHEFPQLLVNLLLTTALKVRGAVVADNPFQALSPKSLEDVLAVQFSPLKMWWVFFHSSCWLQSNIDSRSASWEVSQIIACFLSLANN